MRYTVILEQEEGGGYVVTVPVLPGCVSQGDTKEEALANIREAAELYIETCLAEGIPLHGRFEKAEIELDISA